MPNTSAKSLHHLRGSQSLIEQNFNVRIPFDGWIAKVQATFVDGGEILIGTRLLRDYRLTIDFPAGTVLLERVTISPEGSGTP